MAITVKHSKVSTIPDDADTSLVRPSDWNADHTLVGLGTMAEQNANAVAITGGTITGVSGLGDVVGPASSTDNAVARFDTTTGKLIQNSGVTIDDNSNITANALDDGYLNTAASGTPIVLTSASVRRYTITGSGGQTIKLPNATTLSNGTVFQFDNNQSSGAITVNNNSNTLVVSVPSGGFVLVNLLSNATAAGSWDRHDQAPANVSWSTNTFDYAGSITSATWNGNTVAVNRGGTGVTTSTGSGSNVLNTSPTLTTPAITGGTIDNTVIGATTPAAGTFTTITGQTEVLKGTGNNIVKQSQAWATSPWFNANLTSITNNTTDLTAPDGTSTATKVVAASSSASVGQNIGSLNTTLYQASVYAKCDTGTLSATLIVYLSSSPFTAILSQTITLTTAWQRFSYTTTAPPANASYNYQLNINAAGTAYTWGAQLEVGATVNTYIPTTTTAVYGTPSLSFSGVAGLGLESNGSLYVSPAGTGALQAQATTSTTVGGNARGANAVDWQTLRAGATAVASGSYSVVGGGYNNSTSGVASVIAGGYSNIITTNGYAGFVGGGQANQTQAQNSAVVGGYTNLATGFFNFIGGGSNNSATAQAAVTTQTTTTVTSGSTAVTLSGSNASIKVGQLISGTGMANFTYVAAISGTSLTLSQNANATGTPTLSFYTPHGVVVGGGNNQATGSYSFIGGGGDAGTAANRNTASGDWSFVGGGRGNQATGTGAVIAGGGTDGSNAFPNTATTTICTVGGGFLNNATAYGGVIIGGGQNTANGIYSNILGGTQGTARGITGYTVFSASNTPIANASGVSQSALLVLGVQTTDATATVLRSNTSAAGGTNQVILPNNSAYYFKVRVIAGVTGAGNTKAWTLEGAIKRGAGVGTTAIVGTVTTTIVAADAGASTWTVTATADTTNGGLAITVTGQASTTIRWVAKAETAEMTF
jgi:hypothetical protein